MKNKKLLKNILLLSSLCICLVGCNGKQQTSTTTNKKDTQMIETQVQKEEVSTNEDDLTQVDLDTETSTETSTETEEVLKEKDNEQKKDNEQEDILITEDEIKENVKNVKENEKEKIRQEIENKLNENLKEDENPIEVITVRPPSIDVDIDYSQEFSDYAPTEQEMLTEAAKKLVGLYAQNYDYETVNGEKVSIKDYYGKPFIIEILSLDCSACQSSMETMSKFRELYPNIPLLQIEPDSYLNTIKDKANENIAYANILAGNGNANFKIDYPYTYLPTFLFINSDGYIEKVRMGTLSKDNIFATYSLIK